MRSSLTVAVIFLFSVAVFAQHSSGGSSAGSSSGSSAGSSAASSSGGASHSGGSSSGGGGSYSGGHSSGGGSSSGSSHASGSSGSGSHGRSDGNSSRSTHEPQSNTRQFVRDGNGHGTTIREPHSGPEKSVQPVKRSFFSVLRHPFHKPQPKPEADLRRRVCITVPCHVCPVGQASNGKGGCAVGYFPHNDRNRYSCSNAEVWAGSECLAHTTFLDSCSGLRMAMERQEERMRTASSVRQGACLNGATQECSEMTARFQSEASLYQALQQKYQQCQRSSTTSTYTSGRWINNWP